MYHSTENPTCRYTFHSRKSPSGQVVSNTLTEKDWEEARCNELDRIPRKTAHSTLIVLDFPGKLLLQRTEDVESI